MRHFLKTMASHWRKSVFFSVVNVLGLAIGLAASFLIYCYVDFEYSYDRFHTKADRIYRLVCDTRTVTDSGARVTSGALTAAPMGPLLQASFPQIESVVRFFKGNLLVRRGTVRFQEKRTVVVDADLLKVFDFPLLAGDPATAFKTPQSVVFTASAARKYFGAADPLGQTVYLGPQGWPTRVSGVLKDLPENSQIKADLFFTADFAADSNNWSQLSDLTYLLMKPGADPGPLQRIPPILRGDNVYTLSLEPFTGVHLYSHRPGGFESGNIDNVRLFSFVAIFILLIVTFDFANLATAQAVDRIRTIGTCKLLGASRRRLFRQLMGETLLLSLLAFLLAAVTARVLLPVFNQLAGKTISTGIFGDLHRYIVLFAGSQFAGIAAGIYPAVFLSGYPALMALRDSFRPGKSGFVVRRCLVSAQFTLAFVLILGTLVIERQLHYMRSADPGFTSSQLLVIDTRTDPGGSVFRQNIARLPAVLSTSFSSDIPGSDVNAAIAVTLEEAGGRMIDVRWAGCSVDFDYFRTFDIRMAAGRTFSRSLSTDTLQAVILNETAAHSLGYAEAADAIGRRCIRNGLAGTVIGVVKDFHTRSFREPIAPLVLWLQPQDHDEYLSVRVSAGNLPATLAALTKTYNAAMPGRPFNYFFLDDYIAGLYRSETVFGRIFGMFTILAVLLSCIGLLGFAAYDTVLRQKEIGIRKVLGASVRSVLWLLLTDLARPFVLALLAGAPLALIFIRSWLDHYAYRIHTGAGLFLSTAGLLAVIVLTTVAYHATRSALLSPLRVIRKN